MRVVERESATRINPALVAPFAHDSTAIARASENENGRLGEGGRSLGMRNIK
jgi:hypothetical protein